jgi:hypothetical protein
MRACRTYVVRPEQGHTFYRDLADRVYGAMSEFAIELDLISPSDLPENLGDARLVIVNPVECALSGGSFIARASAARFRIMALAECAETKWYEDQFKVGLHFDALLDVGFTPQRDHHRFDDTPYRFVFNGTSADDLFAVSPQEQRPIAWALIGHATLERARLTAALCERISPGGFVFLPVLGPPSSEGMLSSDALRRVLRLSRLYVWRSHHGYRYYESFRFRDAILCGTAPCKIDPDTTEASVPGVYRSLDDLRRVLAEAGFQAMVDEAVSFYVSRGRLADHLKNALDSLDA